MSGSRGKKLVGDHTDFCRSPRSLELIGSELITPGGLSKGVSLPTPHIGKTPEVAQDSLGHGRARMEAETAGNSVANVQERSGLSWW